MSSAVSAQILNPNSFHPVSQVPFSLSAQDLLNQCSLHLLYRLSPSLFIDPYELRQREASYKFTAWGITELEKPANAIENSDTNVLFTLTIPSRRKEVGELEFKVEIPLHARYLAPSSRIAPSTQVGAYRHIPLERPQAFFACPTGPSQDLSKPPLLPAHMSPSRLAEVNMTSTTTEFSYLPYSPNDPVKFIRVPVGRHEHLFSVQLATSAVILFAFCWVGVAVLQTARRLSESQVGIVHQKKD